MLQAVALLLLIGLGSHAAFPETPDPPPPPFTRSLDGPQKAAPPPVAPRRVAASLDSREELILGSRLARALRRSLPELRLAAPAAPPEAAPAAVAALPAAGAPGPAAAAPAVRGRQLRVAFEGDRQLVAMRASPGLTRRIRTSLDGAAEVDEAAPRSPRRLRTRLD